MRTMLILGSLAVVALAGCTTGAYDTMPVDDWKAAYEATPDAFLLDVRTVPEYEQHHIANATLIPHTALEGHGELLPEDKDTPIFVYCRSGSRSAVASDTLVDMGYTHVVNLAGGINDWIANGHPVVGA